MATHSKSAQYNDPRAPTVLQKGAPHAAPKPLQSLVTQSAVQKALQQVASSPGGLAQLQAGSALQTAKKIGKPILPNYVGDLGSQRGVIAFEDFVTIEAAGSGTKEAIQPSYKWIRGCNFPTYHMQVEITERSANATIYIESSTTAEGPWDTVKAFTAVTNTMIVISSEGGENKFNGLVRWRVSGTAPWQVCFQFHAMPGASISDKFAQPIRP